VSTVASPTPNVSCSGWASRGRGPGGSIRLIGETATRAETSTRPGPLFPARAAWSRSASKLILNLYDPGVIQASLLAEVVDRIIKLGSRAGDITSLGLSGARILRDTCGDLVVELSNPPEMRSALSFLTVETGPQPEAARESARLNEHSRLAAELRALTGLPAASLAAAFGVSREQYQRWLSGRPISSVRHGQLVYTHSIAAEVVRKLGESNAKIWWRTPRPSGSTPEQSLRERDLAVVYRAAVDIADPRPVVGKTLLGLRRLDESWSEEPPDGVDEQDDWSPYPTSGRTLA